MSFERSILRAGQAVKSVRPENKFWVPCEHSLTLSLTMQKYESFIAVHECVLSSYERNSGNLRLIFLAPVYFPQFPLISFPCFCGGHDGHDGQSQNEKRECQNRHYNITILFIYSEQMTESDIDFDQNDHDHDDHGVDLSVITNHIILAGNNKNRPFHRDFF